MEHLRRVCLQLRESVPELYGILSDLEKVIPIIVVVGAQCAGKSSLLNRLLPPCLTSATEEDFEILPTKGGTTCTKFPITLSFVIKPQAHILLTIIQDGKEEVCYESAIDDAADGTMSRAELQKVRNIIQSYNNDPARKMFGAEMFLTVGAPSDDIASSYELVDLPGLVADKSVGDVIDAGVRKRVVKADIVIVCKQMNVDIMACQSGNIVRECRKPGSRVIVVSTYADTRVTEEHIRAQCAKADKEGWRSAFSTNKKSKADEASWLRGRHPYLPGLCGALDLQREIRDCYTAMMQANAPVLRKKVNELKDGVTKNLETIGREARTLEHVRSALNGTLNRIGNPKRGEVSEVDVALQRCLSSFEESVPENLINTFLSDAAFVEGVIHGGMGAVHIRGTEGMCQYLSTAYMQIANRIAPDVQACLEDAVGVFASDLCSLLGRMLSSPCYQRARIELDESISIAVRAPNGVAAVISATLGVIEEEPTSEKSYAHNAYLDAFMLDIGRSLGQRCIEFEGKKYYAHDDINELVVGVEKINRRPVDVVCSNVTGIVRWYWDEYRTKVIHIGKRQLRNCAKVLLAAIRAKGDELIFSKDETMFTAEDDATKQRRATLLEAEASLLETLAGLN
jgi:hypothetical protein